MPNQVALNWRSGGVRAVNVLQISIASNPLDQNDLLSLSAIIDSTLCTRMSNEWALESISQGGAQPISIPTEAGGTQNGPSVAANTAYLINKSPASGRRGRFYLPGMLETFVDSEGNLTSNAISSMNTQLDNFLGNLTSGGFDFTVGDDFSVGRPIVSLSCDSRAATQRRRMRR